MQVNNGNLYWKNKSKINKIYPYLTHDIKEGFNLKGTDNNFSFHRSSLLSYAIHIEYDYLNRGPMLELADNKDTYFIYPLNRYKELTKIHFAVEHIYDLMKNKLK